MFYPAKSWMFKKDSAICHQNDAFLILNQPVSIIGNLWHMCSFTINVSAGVVTVIVLCCDLMITIFTVLI